MQKITQPQALPLEGGGLDNAMLYPLEPDILQFKYMEKGYLGFWDQSRTLGLMDAKGKVIIPAGWESIHIQADPGVIWCTKQGRTVLFDLRGNTLLGQSPEALMAMGRGVAVKGSGDTIIVLDELGAFFEGLARGRQGSTTYHVNAAGRAVLRCQKHGIGDFHCGRALFQPKTGLFQKKLVGYADRQGKVAIPATYRDGDNFSGDLAAVRDDTGRHYIRTDGSRLECFMMVDGKRVPLPPLYQTLPFRGGYAPVMYFGKFSSAVLDGVPISMPEELGGWGILHNSGELTVPFRYNELIPTQEEDVFIVSPMHSEDEEPRYGLIGPRGEVILKPEFRKLVPIGKGLYAFIRDLGIGVIDRTGKVIVEPVWDSVSESCGKAINVKKNGRWGLMDLRGEILLPAVYSNQIIHTAGLSVADREGEAKLLNRWGKSAIPEDIRIRQCVEAGLLWVTVDGQSCLLDYGFTP